MTMSSESHARLSRHTPARCAVVTVSDTRTVETDMSGQWLIEHIKAAGHSVEAYQIVPDDADTIRTALNQQPGAVDIVITTGGTGITRRDTTVEVAESLITTPIPGFGELFRMLSYGEIGPAAMLSRATAGLYGRPRTVLFCLPGSKNAVTLAAERLIVPQLFHLAWELDRHG